MERRLFDELAVAPGPRGRPRRVGLLPSLVIHVVVLGVIVLVPILAPDVLPTIAGSPADDLTVARVVVPPPPPRRGRSPDQRPRRAGRRAAPTLPVSSPTVVLPSSWSELAVDDDSLGVMDDLPVCEGCVPWGIDDGVPGLTPSAPPEAPPAPVVRTGTGVEPPLKIRHVVPEYPGMARTIGLEGVVIIECRVDVGGAVVDARVLRGHPLLDPAALEAVRQWRYRPTLLNGQPVSVVMTVTVRFQLR
jgi:protein TonB